MKAVPPTAVQHQAPLKGAKDAVQSKGRVTRRVWSSEQPRKVRARISGPVLYPCTTQDIPSLPHVCLLPPQELYVNLQLYVSLSCIYNS
ncbi:hypothetical protein V5799_012170 [Amblyomma americanum]|uniref:Uncharacterized protein n=1 Tax=Amblyomma americanum TaxID=6943 RepID=A0AAQ4EEU4_AMBAM